MCILAKTLMLPNSTALISFNGQRFELLFNDAVVTHSAHADYLERLVSEQKHKKVLALGITEYRHTNQPSPIFIAPIEEPIVLKAVISYNGNRFELWYNSELVTRSNHKDYLERLVTEQKHPKILALGITEYKHSNEPVEPAPIQNTTGEQVKATPWDFLFSGYIKSEILAGVSFAPEKRRGRPRKHVPAPPSGTTINKIELKEATHQEMTASDRSCMQSFFKDVYEEGTSLKDTLAMIADKFEIPYGQAHKELAAYF
jgi:hypothetical protein